ncbi:MAG: ArnT family glycosyltransferase, partial [Gammaproteobacteria bacterium]
MFDEAQYWLWSLSPDWGYYSKPPLIAWAIWSTTHACGHTEWCVRFASPVAHALASIGVYHCARLLFAPGVPAPAGTGLIKAVSLRQQPDSEDMPPEMRADRIAFWSGLLYATAPGVSFSSTLISTDPFLLLFWAWSLYFFIYAVHQPERDARRFWVLAGIATGLGILSKYAMLLFIPSAILCLVLVPGGLSRIRSFGFWLYVTVALAFLMPNVLWNLAHGLVTISHTWGNAGLGGSLINPGKMLEFLVGQLGVFGPVFIIFMGMLFARPWATRGDKRYLILFSFSFPYLFLYLTLSLISRAHANWSAPVYVAGAIMVAAWLMETQARKCWLVAALAVNMALMGFLVTYPASVKLVGIQPAKSNDLFFRQRGQRAYSEAVAALWNDYPGTLLVADTRYIV